MEIVVDDLLSEVHTPDGAGVLVGRMITDGAVTGLIVRLEGDTFPGDRQNKVRVAVVYEPDQVWVVYTSTEPKYE